MAGIQGAAEPGERADYAARSFAWLVEYRQQGPFDRNRGTVPGYISAPTGQHQHVAPHVRGLPLVLQEYRGTAGDRAKDQDAAGNAQCTTPGERSAGVGA